MKEPEVVGSLEVVDSLILVVNPKWIWLSCPRLCRAFHQLSPSNPSHFLTCPRTNTHTLCYSHTLVDANCSQFRTLIMAAPPYTLNPACSPPTPPEDTPPCRLLELPGEIRNRIYRLVLVISHDRHLIAVTPSGYDRSGLVQTCKQIQAE